MRSPTAQDDLWNQFVRKLRTGPARPFEDHWARFRDIYADRKPEDGPPLVCRPSDDTIARSNLGRFMQELGFGNYGALYEWTAKDRAGFWQKAIERLGIVFARKPESIIGNPTEVKNPRWLDGAQMNCVDSCFTANPQKTAVVAGREGTAELVKTTYGELEQLVNRVANGLIEHGFESGQGIALYMPMTLECVAAYLGIVRTGCSVISIADSFSPQELSRRLDISGASGIVTVQSFTRAGKTIDLYAKVREAGAPKAIVIPADTGDDLRLRQGDCLWSDFLSDDDGFTSAKSDPYGVTNVLFSSGTTAAPKAIPWTHLTPIKCAMDGYFHQDIHGDDVVAWPTNIGWMMGPWLIYATLINDATMALYEGAPTGEGFTRFVEDAAVSVLGTVPTLVRAWRSSGTVRQDRWRSVRVFSSTGEPSDQEDYLWLMSRTGYRAPVIEYCGGTEIGGGFLTGTVVQPASPATFTTPTLGIGLAILNEHGQPVKEGESGEVYLIPPSIGLSETLLNKDHEDVYYSGCPTGPNGETLRRHRDRVALLHKGFYKAQGRTDDTMNLGGIKVSALELERVLDTHPAVHESAAVGVQPAGEGAEKLAVYIVPSKDVDAEQLKQELASAIAKQINPLFKIHALIVTDSLPRTASNKLMRRALRDRYLEHMTDTSPGS